MNDKCYCVFRQNVNQILDKVNRYTNVSWKCMNSTKKYERIPGLYEFVS